MDGLVATDIEALRQRLEQAVQFVLGTWFLDTNAGLDRDLIQGHDTTTEIASTVITEAIIDEGGDEVLTVDVELASLDVATRVFRYRALVDTIYGRMTQESTIG